MDLQVRRSKSIHGNDSSDDGEPVSPASRFLNTCVVSLCVHGIFEFEHAIEISPAKKALTEILLPRIPRFSCIIAEDKQGVARWKKTQVKIDDHITIPQFPPDQDDYDDFVNEYICNVHLTPLVDTRPPWQFHFLNYKTSKAAAVLIISLHHTIGDGVSLMSLLLSCVTRVDNPTLPPTFPAASKSRLVPRPQIKRPQRFLYKLWQRLLIAWYTGCDLISTLVHLKWIEDSELPIRGPPGVELLPKVMSHVTFKLDEIRQIKKHIGGTVNDVVTGIIFYGLHRYLLTILSGEMNSETNSAKVLNEMENLRVTALALINTRSLSGLQNIEEMLKSHTETPWGNHFGFLHSRIPLGKVENPLEFVQRAKRLLERKKMSRAVFLTSKMLSYLTRFRGAQASAKIVYNTGAKTTLAISNLVGPLEKVAMAGNPVKDFFFCLSGAPQTLFVGILSYAGSLRVQAIGTRGYVEADILSTCFAEAFEEIKQASVPLHQAVTVENERGIQT